MRRALARSLLALLAILATPACAQTDGTDPAARDAILVLGDSVMAWNEAEGAAVADGLRDVLGVPVTSRAVPGATLLGPEKERIGAGYAPGPWAWVVVQGGANDLVERCGCGPCDATLDRLLAPDARSGVVADLVADVRRDGAGVVLWSYYDVPDRAPFPYGRCGDELAVMRQRFTRLAERDPRIVVVDGREAVDPRRPGDYDPDAVHPSPAGSRAIAKHLAAALRDTERGATAAGD
ncbi:MAG: SGNH/GDSL hydrolase family protein [Trueperaceae bacterium]|nr:SGNH/GDSL hydrolase family protein [Trueperaceae bacterium]